MRNIILFSLIAISSLRSPAQCDDGRYRDMIFPYFTSIEDVEYGSNLLFSGTSETLLMDIYMPHGDTEVNRPLVILAHGGFFFGGDKQGTDVKPASIDLARMGYVTASINYRLGFPIQLELEQPMAEAVLRGVHDLKAAVRWFRKDVAENGNTYGINPDKIFILGVSAGGFITLQLAYLDDIEELPEYIDFDHPGLNGGLEGESGSQGYSSEVMGVVSVAGAISDTTFIEAGDMPACLFHGTGDTVVPFDSDMLVIADTFPVTEVDGSNSVDQKMTELGITHCFEIYEGQGHVPSDGNGAYYDTTLSVISNFLSYLVCDIELDCSYREIAVGVEDEEILSRLKLFPNPTSGLLTINTLNSLSPSKLRLSDLSGRLILESTGVGEVIWDLSHISPGMYTVKMWSTLGVYTSNLIVE